MDIADITVDERDAIHDAIIELETNAELEVKARLRNATLDTLSHLRVLLAKLTPKAATPSITSPTYSGPRSIAASSLNACPPPRRTEAADSATSQDVKDSLDAQDSKDVKDVKDSKDVKDAQIPLGTTDASDAPGARVPSPRVRGQSPIPPHDRVVLRYVMDPQPTGDDDRICEQAYAWLIGDRGEALGLTAGDHGYELTTLRFPLPVIDRHTDRTVGFGLMIGDQLHPIEIGAEARDGVWAWVVVIDPSPVPIDDASRPDDVRALTAIVDRCTAEFQRVIEQTGDDLTLAHHLDDFQAMVTGLQRVRASLLEDSVRREGAARLSGPSPH